MIRWLRALSPTTEFAVIIVLSLGYFIFGSLAAALFQRSPAMISQLHLEKLLIYEPLVLALLGLFLYVRQWTAKALGFSFKLADLPSGLLLAIGTYAAAWLLWFVMTQISGKSFTELAATRIALPGFKMMTVIAVSIVNPIFEELFVCAYAVSFVQRYRGRFVAVVISAALRFLYHLYQGVAGALSVLGVGVVFAAYFAWKKRAWPVVIAHGLLDLIALAPFIG